ncbi:response regulator [candidate division WOR-3 bacterium]|nr:response regulator [candidate division WOR-3 bacterium]
MPKISIKTRVLAGFSAVALLVVLSSLFGFLYILSAENTVQQIVSSARKRQMIMTAENKWKSIISDIDNILLTRQSVGVKKKLDLTTDSFIKDMEILINSLSTEDLESTGELYDFGKKLKDIVAGFSRDVELGRWSRAQYTRHNELASLQRRFEERMDSFHLIFQKEAEEALEQSRRIMNAMRVFWVLAAAAIILLSVFSNLSTSRNIILPISKLIKTSKTIESGDLSCRVEMPRGDEFEILANSFNSMTDRLQNLIHTLEGEIAERKKAETALRKSEERYRNIFENAIDGIFQSTIEGRFIDVNPSMITILGYKSKEDLFQNCTDITKQLYVFPEEREKYVAEILQHGKVIDRELQLFRKDSQKIWVSLSSRLVNDDVGKPAYLEGFLSDITERKKLSEQLYQSQKMEAIGRLAGGIAHDFNNILTIIVGYGDLLLMENFSEENKNAIEQMLEAGNKGKRLTGHLLAFSRKQMIKPKVVNANTLIKKEHEMLARILGEDIKTELILEKNLGKIRVDETQFEQVVLNIAVNARDAMPKGGKMIIETQNMRFERAKEEEKVWIAPGNYVLISFSDNGIGMDQYVKEHIFEPFFTTKEKDKGTGLGLSTVYGVVKQNDGYISVNSELEKGSTFKLYFPRIDDETPEDKDSVENERAVIKNASVLLAEDDPGVRKITKEMLVSLGYDVLTADNGEEAISVFSRRKDEIDILLTDIIMPIMGGKELAEELLKRKKTLKIVYFSGYTENNVLEQKIMEKNFKYLQKPFSIKELYEALN